MEVQKVDMDEMKTETELHIKRPRKKTNYRKINNQTRQQLVEMVYLKDYLLKDAAKCLNINYSTAKTILRIFRIEKRIEKKNTDEERELKDLLCKFKKDKAADVKEENEENTHSLREDSFKSQKDTKESQTNTSLRTGADLDSNKGITAELALRIDFFSKKIKDFHNTLNDCYKEIKNNQLLPETSIQGTPFCSIEEFM